MGFIKTSVKRFVNRFGYELKRKTSHQVAIDNLVNLARSYESILNNSGFAIEANATRLKLLPRLLGTSPFEAYYIVDALARTSEVDGDVCEFGVAQGETSALIANELSLSDKHLHLFDSFEGLPEPTEKDQLKDDIFNLESIEAYAGTMSYPQALVRARLNAVGFPESRLTIHKGFIGDVLRKGFQLPVRVSFAYVDFDFYEPIRDALQFLDGATGTGSMVIVDDYDFFSSGAKTAVDEFLEEANRTGKRYECTIPHKELGHFAVLSRIV